MFQEPTGVGSWYSTILNLLTSSGENNNQNRKIVIFCFFTEMKITKVTNNLKAEIRPSYAKLYYLKCDNGTFANLPSLIIFQFLDKFVKISKNFKDNTKSCYHFLDNVILHNLAKFLLSRPF